MTTRESARTIASGLAILVATVVFAEGTSSILLAARRIASAPAPRTRPDSLHTRYDPELGWVGVPNLTLKDFYAPGATIQTNSQGFRETAEFSAAVPQHRVRVLCSGDSFTFGYDVGEQQPWCKALARADSRLETLNIGLVGYGIDQSYLLYRRVAPRYAHDVVCFAFITDDFLRMKTATFADGGKPVLRLRGESLVVENVPVPPRHSTTAWRPNWSAGLTDLRLTQLVVAARNRLAPGRQGAERTPDSATVSVALRTLEEVRSLAASRGASTLFIYLPTIEDYAGDASTAVRRRLHAAAAERGWDVLDLVDSLRAIPADSVGPLFFPPGQHPLRSPRLGHPTPRGHQWIADLVYRRLLSMPRPAARLAPSR